MSSFADYSGRYRTIAMERRDGILQVRLHTDGGPARWGVTEDHLHAELGRAFGEIAQDTDNKVVIVTGTGDSFCAQFDTDGPRIDTRTPDKWDRIIREGQALIDNLLAIPVPVIGAVNGPALIHAEIPVLSDIVLASDTAVFADIAHVPGGAAPGDGVQVIWPMLLGPNRGRYFLLTGQRIAAAEALALGIVGEVLPPDRLFDRAWELATQLSRNTPLMLRNSRTVLTRYLRRRMAEEVATGLTIQGMSLLRAG
jgi:enoyl-CoA hydratase/carnithine racemase